MLVDAQGGESRAKYGDELIKRYSIRLTNELGKGFSFIKSEYKIKIGNNYNYIDENIKTFNQDKTIGVIIYLEDNKPIIRYCSNPRIFSTTYKVLT